MNKLTSSTLSGVGAVLIGVLALAALVRPAPAASGDHGSSSTLSRPAYQRAFASTTAVNLCQGFSGAAFGLCTASCNAMQCGSETQQASQRACDEVANVFRQVTGTLPPCMVSGPPPGPDLQRCFCNDGTQIDLCAQVDCSSGPAQDEICGPVCTSHGGLFATGCLTADPSCAAQ